MNVPSEYKEQVDEWICNALMGCYQPTPDEKIWEWAERTLRIPETESQEYGGQLWSSKKTPWVRELMEWFREPGAQEFFVRKSSQVGITMAVLIVIVWAIVHKPVNVGYYIDSAEEAKKISRTRLKPWIMKNKILDKVGEESEDLTNLCYYLKGMTVYLHGSYSGGAFRNKSITWAIGDELDAHDEPDGLASSADRLRGRIKVPINSKLFCFSSPKLESGQITQEYETGTQEKIFVWCPHCNHAQPLIWTRVKFEHCRDLAGEYEMQRVRDETYYECEMGCKIQQREHSRLLEKVDFRATEKPKKLNKRSLQINDLYSQFTNWGVLAEEWIEAQKSRTKLRQFIQERLGEPDKELGGEVRQSHVRRLRQKYHKGTCPVKPWFTCMIVDVQKETQKWVKFVFMKNGDMYVIDWGECASWQLLADEFETPFYGPDGEEYFIQYGFVDEGDGHRAMEVRRFCQPLYPDVTPVKGRAGLQVKDLVYLSKPYNIDGEYMRTYHISDHDFKMELLFDRILRDKRNQENEKPRMYLPRPQDVDPSFMAELVAEKLVFKKDKSGFERRGWEKTGDNDYLDCCKYALALNMVVAPAIREQELQNEKEESEQIEESENLQTT